ncbi:hypothetical protein RND81_02G227100 [Saponaria officinalis]|uniref:J domain-containing protein n=1 Tax=Saponaria officinalis TaxID=3572 RepID=A0AAW1MTB7_SAPOF
MGVDYYNILKVTRATDDDELRRAYKNLAMRWHPDKHPSGTKPLAESKFKQICEAYDILSDPTKRHIYDVYGHDGLLYNVSSPSAATATVRKAGSFRGRNDDALDCFDEFLADQKSPSFKSDDGGGGGGYGRSNSRMRRSSPLGSKAVAIENKLGCSLEELYKGSKRKMVISRIVPDSSGKPSTVEEVLAIDIKPGWKKGTKITFPDKGNHEPGMLPGDLIFVIDEKPHLTFKRDGNDLLVNQKVSLVEALTGKTLNLTTLDGRNLDLEVSDVIKPGHEVVIPGEGMPISREPTKKGNLRIKFDVKFPSKLSSDQKTDIKRVLSRRT